MNRAVVLPNHRDHEVAIHIWPGNIQLSKPGGNYLCPELPLPRVVRIPNSWRFPIATFLALLLLAGLDFAGAIFAKGWSDQSHLLLLVGGLASFSVLFIIFARVLAVTELSVATLGWVVILQIGMLAMDRVQYEATLPWQKWAAIIAILVLQSYLLTSSATRRQVSSAETGGTNTASLHSIKQPLPR